MTILPLALLLTLEANPLLAGDHSRSVKVDERMRTYHVHIPKTCNVKKPTPIVLALHGAAMTGKMMKLYSGLDRTADEGGFVVVYPDGTGSGALLTWNAGGF